MSDALCVLSGLLCAALSYLSIYAVLLLLARRD